MLVCFTFTAKPGKEKEFEALLADRAGGERAMRGQGATRNTLFLGGGRMVRVLEFPDGAKPVPLGEAARKDPALHAFLKKLGPLVENGFDVDSPGSLEAFVARQPLKLAYDVRV